MRSVRMHADLIAPSRAGEGSRSAFLDKFSRMPKSSAVCVTLRCWRSSFRCFMIDRGSGMREATWPMYSSSKVLTAPHFAAGLSMKVQRRSDLFQRQFEPSAMADETRTLNVCVRAGAVVASARALATTVDHSNQLVMCRREGISGSPSANQVRRPIAQLTNDFAPAAAALRPLSLPLSG